MLSKRQQSLVHIIEIIRMALEAGWNYIEGDHVGNIARAIVVIVNTLTHIKDRCEQTGMGEIYHGR
jgi:hypothetical protein